MRKSNHDHISRLAPSLGLMLVTGKKAWVSLPHGHISHRCTIAWAQCKTHGQVGHGRVFPLGCRQGSHPPVEPYPITGTVMRS